MREVHFKVFRSVRNPSTKHDVAVDLARRSRFVGDPSRWGVLVQACGRDLGLQQSVIATGLVPAQGMVLRLWLTVLQEAT